MWRMFFIKRKITQTWFRFCFKKSLLFPYKIQPVEINAKTLYDVHHGHKDMSTMDT